ncbi:hypothetical protein D9758_010722 [Tetrapyrgos nigripes]|uniref:Uncharacterized protein n=1 Tax=Tetrapyrgos nigripes TaxID=182062 RepID=A0A8H5D729_9AGAR|nr:hypothetical protein D9758_010722 [Tetrapyrgos nigripes]
MGNQSSKVFIAHKTFWAVFISFMGWQLPEHLFHNFFTSVIIILSPKAISQTPTLTPPHSYKVSPRMQCQHQPVCGIPKLGKEGSIGNRANLVVCVLSMLAITVVIWLMERRKAAVGHIKLHNICYFLTLPLQILTTGSFLEQGSTVPVILTAIHSGFRACFWGGLSICKGTAKDGNLGKIDGSFRIGKKIRLMDWSWVA